MKRAGFALVLFLSVVVGSSAQETAAPAPSKIGNGVSAPVVVSAPNPQYTNEGPRGEGLRLGARASAGVGGRLADQRESGARDRLRTGREGDRGGEAVSVQTGDEGWPTGQGCDEYPGELPDLLIAWMMPEAGTLRWE